MSSRVPATSPGAEAILHALVEGAGPKPRTRSEWQWRFGTWAKRESDTEAERIDAAKRRVGRALQRSRFLKTRQWEFVPQGSWHNRTNVRGDSDVDLCVCLTDAYFYDVQSGDSPTLDELSMEPVPFTFLDFKAEIERCLRDQYGTEAVDRGGKALHLHKDDDERVSVDVVPTFTFRSYDQPSILGRAILAEGVALLTDHGVRVTNFPVQHLANGRAFHEGTGRRFKKVVRILKRMRNHIAGNTELPQAMRTEVRKIPSFLIECLVYNCPTDCFGNPEIYDDVVAVLAHLQEELTRPDGLGILSAAPWRWWQEVNRQKLLFGGHQPTTATQVLGFVTIARTYMGA
jgi:hypothetical protein